MIRLTMAEENRSLRGEVGLDKLADMIIVQFDGREMSLTEFLQLCDDARGILGMYHDNLKLIDPQETAECTSQSSENMHP